MSDAEEDYCSVRLLECVELTLSLDVDIIFNNCASLVFCNEKMLVVVSGDYCGNAGYCLLASYCVFSRH